MATITTAGAARVPAGATGCCSGARCEHGETRTGTAVAGVPQRVELSVEGLSTDAVAAAARALRAARGVTEALVNPITARAVLELDPAEIRVEALTKLLEGRGARAGDRLARWHVPVPGLACARCAARIEEEVGRVPGVHGATVNRSAESLTVEYTPSGTALDTIRAILATV